MFADIMTPGRRHGPRRRAGRGRRPGRGASRCATLAAVETPPRARPRGARRRSARDGRDRARASSRPDQAVVGFCGGPFTVAGYLVEGRPSREFAGTKTLMYAEPEVWHALLDKLAETFARVRRRAGARRRGRRAALRLVGRRALAGRLRASSWRRSRRGCSGAARCACPRSTSAPAPRRSCRRWPRSGGDVIGLDWRVPLDEGWERGRRGPRRPGQPRPRGAARAVGARREPRCATCSPAPAAGPATSSTSGTACCPRTDPDVLGRLREFVHAETSVGQRAPGDRRSSGAPSDAALALRSR